MSLPAALEIIRTDSIGRALDLPLHAVWRLVDDGEAHAGFPLDIEAKECYQVCRAVSHAGAPRGPPAALYGNVGYPIVEAERARAAARPALWRGYVVLARRRSATDVGRR